MTRRIMAKSIGGPRRRFFGTREIDWFRPRLEILEERYLLAFTPATVLTRQVFYDNSGYDGGTAGINIGDDAAIATDKVALSPGAASSFRNVTSYPGGINGLVVDITGSHPSITASDFTFLVGDSASGPWTAAPGPTALTVRGGQGASGSDRIEMVWTTGAVKNRWLQVIVGANQRTQLAAADVFMFGNRVGDTGFGSDPEAVFTDGIDVIQVRNHIQSDLGDLTNAWDLNRDDSVDGIDIITARANVGELALFPFSASPPSLLAALVNDTAQNGQTNSDGVTSDATISGNVHGTNTIVSLQVRLGSQTAQEKIGLVQGNGNFSIDSTVLTSPNGGTPLADGSYNLRLQATDNQGLTAYWQVPFTLKRSVLAPSLPDLIANDDTGDSNSDNLTKVATPTLQLNNVEPGAIVTIYDGANPITQGTLDASGQLTLPSLSDGMHTITAKSQDVAGNVSSSSPILSLQISTALPSVTAATMASISDDLTPHVSVTTTNPAGSPAALQVKLDVDLNYDGDFSDANESNRTSSTAVNGQSTFQMTPALPSSIPTGPYYIGWRVRVTDAAGNEGTSAVHSLKIDTSTSNALAAYLATPDPSYGYSLNKMIGGTKNGVGYVSYVLDLTSQTWHAGDVNIPVWHHWLQVIVPNGAINSSALMYIHGGSNTSSAPTTVDQSLADYATIFHSVIVDLPMVPNEPVTFNAENPQVSRSEDAIIAYTFDHFEDNLGAPGNETWPLLLPMVRSATAAMTATQSWVTTLGGGRHVDDFLVTGYSKRGWTTWLTAAADNRVKAIIPGVFDNLNVDEEMVHHYGVYTGFSYAVADYTAFNLPQNSFTTAGEALGPIIDPYRYLNQGNTRFDNMPKLIINGSEDEYFVPDSSQYYFSDLPGTKNYLRYIPDVGHSLNNVDPVNSTKTFYNAVLNNLPLPQFSWTLEQDGSIRVQTVDTPLTVTLWQSTNPNSRDFRNHILVGGIL